MAAELGIGVRVFITFVANNPLSCHTGTITDGPIPTGTVAGIGEVTREVGWWVDVDNDPKPNGRPWGIGESRLQPIDDDNDQTTRDERELVEERV